MNKSRAPGPGARGLLRSAGGGLWRPSTQPEGSVVDASIECGQDGGDGGGGAALAGAGD